MHNTDGSKKSGEQEEDVMLKLHEEIHRLHQEELRAGRERERNKRLNRRS